MNRKRKLLIKKTATLKNIFLLAMLFSIMAFFIMPEASKQIIQHTKDTNLIDHLFFYVPHQAFAMISDYGEKGRQLYVVVELTADLIFSIVTSLILMLILVWSSLKLKDSFIRFEFLVWFPISGLIINCFENGCIIFMLLHYPETYFYLALITTFFTFAKWLSIIICLAIISWNLIRLIFSHFNFNTFLHFLDNP